MTGEKIYHLPFDQQYDTTIIEYNRGELYVKNAYEAEKTRIQAAWKWHGEKNE